MYCESLYIVYLRSSPKTCFCTYSDNIIGEATCPDNCASLCPQPTTEEQKRCDHTSCERKSQHKVSVTMHYVISFLLFLIENVTE